jgi:hypothetical protein
VYKYKKYGKKKKKKEKRGAAVAVEVTAVVRKEERGIGERQRKGLYRII